jgi:hypothetical protein
LQHATYVPSGLIIYLVVTGLLRQASKSNAKKDGNVLIFDGTPTIKATVILFTVGFALASLYVSLTPPVTIVGSVVFGLIAVAGAYCFPAPIFVGPEGVEQSRWWGGGTVSMSWDSLTRIEFHKGPGTTVLIDRAGHKIVHAGFYCGRAEFLDVCQRRAHIDMITSEF